MYKTGEIYTVMEDFEKLKPGRIDREKNRDLWVKGQWYENGEVNRLFTFYMSGYALGKCVERLNNKG